ncbi:MAG TPA: lipid II flippase MurJ, partial [Gammaproteobacteria bacterium]|nr:lipid II flippase MurJ [Gammaproteobacteria bacterium]
YGKFTANSVEMASKSLTMFAIGIAPFMLIKILAAGFYAKQDMKTPVKIGLMAMVANMLFNLMLIWPLKHAGIALATSLAAILNAGFLFYFLRKREFYIPRTGWKFFTFRLIFANCILAVWLWFGAGELQEWTTHHAAWRFMHLTILLFSAVLIYFAGLWLAGLRPRDLLIPHTSEPRALRSTIESDIN